MHLLKLPPPFLATSSFCMRSQSGVVRRICCNSTASIIRALRQIRVNWLMYFLQLDKALIYVHLECLAQPANPDIWPNCFLSYQYIYVLSLPLPFYQISSTPLYDQNPFQVYPHKLHFLLPVKAPRILKTSPVYFSQSYYHVETIHKNVPPYPDTKL